MISLPVAFVVSNRLVGQVLAEQLPHQTLECLPIFQVWKQQDKSLVVLLLLSSFIMISYKLSGSAVTNLEEHLPRHLLFLVPLTKIRLNLTYPDTYDPI